MERLIQKYIKYFYIALIGGISLQLVETIITTLSGRMGVDTFVLMALAVTNIVILGDSLRHNINQQFLECKINMKVLRFAIAPLIVFQALLCFNGNLDFVMLGNHLMTIILIEIILTYRIKSIEYLEDLASKVVKTNTIREKGE